MSVGGNSSKQKSNTSSASYSSPISVDRVNDYWYNLDALTGGGWSGGSGGSGASGSSQSAAGSNDGVSANWNYIKDFLNNGQDSRYQVATGDPAYSTNSLVNSAGATNNGAGSSGAADSGDQGTYTPGRLSQWATEGTAPVEYQGLTADELAAVGGAGQTRLLTARQTYGDRGSEISADPSMTLAQRQYQGGQNTRELWNTEDAVASEVEAALTDLMSQEAERKYNADVRNSDLTKSDLETLAAIYASLIGTESTSGSTGTSSGNSSGFNFGLW